MTSALSKEKEAELIQAFGLYCIYNPETGHFDKSNTGRVSTKLLSNVVRSLGMCPTEKELAEAEESIGADDFSIDQVREIVAKMNERSDDVDDIVEAYKTMAEDDPDGYISVGHLRQKMRRRLNSDAQTDQMIKEAKPDASGMIDIKEFVQRQFDVRELSIRLPQMRKDPTLQDVKGLLSKYYGDENGPGYAYAYKTEKELAEELSGHGAETQQFLDFGRKQRDVLKEAIDFEIKSKVVEAKLEELQNEGNPYKAAVLLREIDSFHTGYKYIDDLKNMDLPCILKLTKMRQGTKEYAAASAAARKVEDARKRVCTKWEMFYTGRK